MGQQSDFIFGGRAANVTGEERGYEDFTTYGKRVYCRFSYTALVQQTETPLVNYCGCNLRILATSCCMFFVSIFAHDKSEPQVLVPAFTSR